MTEKSDDAEVTVTPSRGAGCNLHGVVPDDLVACGSNVPWSGQEPQQSQYNLRPAGRKLRMGTHRVLSGRFHKEQRSIHAERKLIAM